MIKVSGEMQTSRASINAGELSEDLCARDLPHISSSYGRLVYLAGLRNPDTGRYEYYGSTGNCSSASANLALKRHHEILFRDWVSYPLEEKKSDIDTYISTIDEVGKAELIDAWLRLTPYKNLVPASIQGPERQKHVSDFEAILGLLKNVYGVASPDRDA